MLTTQCRIMLIHKFVSLHDDNVQEFDKMERTFLSVSKIRACQLRTVVELYDMEIHQNICPKMKDDVEKKHESETPIAKLCRQTRENRNRSSDQESKILK